MTSRRLRKLRQQDSIPALLAEAQARHTSFVQRRREAECFAAGLSDEQISQLLATGELWMDAARWTPELLEDS